MTLDERTDARLIELEERVTRLECLLIAKQSWDDERLGPPDWDALIASSAGSEWCALMMRLINEYDPLPERVAAAARREIRERFAT